METSHALIYLILIIAAAKVGGEIAEYFKQPAVVGELLIGVLLGLTALREAVHDPAIVFLVASEAEPRSRTRRGRKTTLKLRHICYC